MCDKCFIYLNHGSILNISTQNSIASSYLKMELVCNILADSKIVITNAEGKTMTLTKSGVYHVRPIGGTFQLYKIKDSGYEFIEFE